MTQHFSSDSVPEARALQAWLILTGHAHSRKTLTYTGLCALMGYSRVMYYCQAADLPPLTILVVNKKTGRPGVGLALYKDRDALRERVFNHPWFMMLPPTPLELATAWNNEGEAFEEDDD
jgi:hypothetical protein